MIFADAETAWWMGGATTVAGILAGAIVTAMKQYTSWRDSRRIADAEEKAKLLADEQAHTLAERKRVDDLSTLAREMLTALVTVARVQEAMTKADDELRHETRRLAEELKEETRRMALEVKEEAKRLATGIPLAKAV